MTSMPTIEREIVAGVDTHNELHFAAVVTMTGELIADPAVRHDPHGTTAHTFARSPGRVAYSRRVISDRQARGVIARDSFECSRDRPLLRRSSLRSSER